MLSKMNQQAKKRKEKRKEKRKKIKKERKEKCSVLLQTKDFEDKCLVQSTRSNQLFTQYCHESTRILNAFKYVVFCNKVL